MRHDFKRHLDHATCNLSLAELAVRYPEVTKSRYKIRDGGGLFLQIEPTNARGWRFNYQRPDNKKPNTISFGAFPEVSLAEAREKCDAARRLVAAGKDPSTNKNEVRRAAALEAAGAVTFLAFTNFEIKNAAGEIEIGAWWQKEYVSEKSRISGEGKSFETLRAVKIQLRTLQAALGPIPVKDIQSGDILAILDRLTNKGNVNKAHRILGMAIRIFDLAVARMVCRYNVATPCKNAIAQHTKVKWPAITDHIAEIGLPETERRVGELMRNIRGVRSRLVVKRALEMMALTFPRPHNITGMLWADITGDLWAIGSSKMKMRRPHKVYLSTQALAILEEMRPITGKGKRVFPTTKNTLTRALKKMGYNTELGGDQSTHGLRSVASTLLHESGQWSVDAIERQLAHKIGGRGGNRQEATRGTYNKAERMDERRAMLQSWADYLERLRDGNVVQFQQAAE